MRRNDLNIQGAGEPGLLETGDHGSSTGRFIHQFGDRSRAFRPCRPEWEGESGDRPRTSFLRFADGTLCAVRAWPNDRWGDLPVRAAWPDDEDDDVIEDDDEEDEDDDFFPDDSEDFDDDDDEDEDEEADD